MQIKTNKWLDGKQQDMWPLAEHIGWAVVTAGPVDLEAEGHTPMWNSGRIKVLPPEYPMILKAIDKDGMAYGYHHDNGVMRMPVTLLKPWRK
jgi:hypothetical protein